VARLAALVAALTVSCQSERWQVLTTEGSPDAVAVLSLAFNDDTHGWAATSTEVLESKDGGKNWVVRLSEPDVSFQALVFPDGDRGWIFGARRDATSQRGVVWRTADGGGTWIEQPTSVPGPISAASFCSVSLGFAVSSEHALRTVDGGVTWAVSFQATATEQLWGVGCSGLSQAWVVGRDTVLHTADGGGSWQRREITDAKTTLTRAYFFDGKGWILGFGGLVLMSEDRGERWKRLPVPTTEALLDIRVNGTEGWIVGARGTILRSPDGGTTWRAHESPTHEDLVTLDFLAQRNGWAGGSRMTVLRLAK
jgi:photosystem II stability/assembly factor-like uncharacterized protein